MQEKKERKWIIIIKASWLIHSSFHFLNCLSNSVLWAVRVGTCILVSLTCVALDCRWKTSRRKSKWAQEEHAKFHKDHSQPCKVTKVTLISFLWVSRWSGQHFHFTVPSQQEGHGFMCVEIGCFMGFLWIPQLPSTLQRHAF